MSVSVKQQIVEACDAIALQLNVVMQAMDEVEEVEVHEEGCDGHCGDAITADDIVPLFTCALNENGHTVTVVPYSEDDELFYLLSEKDGIISDQAQTAEEVAAFLNACVKGGIAHVC